MDNGLKFEHFPEKFREILRGFSECYLEATKGATKELETFLRLVAEQIDHPYSFAPYHQKIRSPFDYYAFSLNFIRPLIDIENSKLLGQDVLEKMRLEQSKGENIVLFANHQTETDPQAISILLEKTFPDIGESIIYVAGERVLTDPLAIPFSMGCDLLCIYSKRYIDHPPEKKRKKQLHNKNTMNLMSTLLKEGGKIIYVAPSGGRDRKNRRGEVEVAPFDPASIQMFYLMAKKAKTPTHFYPLTLATYELLPPPETIQKDLGEKRTAKRCPIQIVFLPEFAMEKFPLIEDNNKEKKRALRAEALWKIVKSTYETL